MTECLFCKIVKGEIPSFKIYEDKEFIAFLDIGPVNKGHTLIVPKQHSETFMHMNKNELGKVMHVVQKVANAILKATKADGFNLMLNNKRAAGQLVDHTHFHIIPRFNGDGFKHWPQGKYAEDETSKIASEIKRFL